MAVTNDFGQPAIREHLDQLLAQDRLPHAILFYGEPGHGMLPATLSLARDLLCREPVAGKACGQCASCHRATELIHPDLHFLLPLPGAQSLSTEFYAPWRKAVADNPWLDVYDWSFAADSEGKRVDMHVKDVLTTIHQLSLQPFEGGRKVLVIWMAQFLAKEGNRLLKLIEEPPAETYFIFITSHREQVLTTIRSRCMQVFFPPVAQEEVERMLVSFAGVDPVTASSVAPQAGQDIARAIAIARQSGIDFRQDLANWFRAIVARKGADIVRWANTMAGREREQQKQFCLFAIQAVRDVLWVTSGARPAEQTAAGKELVGYLSRQFPPESWHHVLASLQETFEKIGRNANTKVLWMFLGIDLKNHLAAARQNAINA